MAVVLRHEDRAVERRALHLDERLRAGLGADVVGGGEELGSGFREGLRCPVIRERRSDDGAAKSFAATAAELLAAADDVRAEPGSEPLVQVEGASLDGSVFVARDDHHLVAAVTKPRPTVGLVFYDLKTCLRMLEREEEAKAAKATKTATRRRTTKKETEEAESESS